jgi:anti-sigma regulatory factor (Ser/Thr protein kinase)
MRFTSTPRGARLARRLVSVRLDEWGFRYGLPCNETVTLIAAELAANAVRHGHVPGRDFHLRLTVRVSGGTGIFRVEVSDTRTECRPVSGTPVRPPLDADSGRGLYLVSELADRWGVVDRAGAPGKSVWAEFCM